MRSLTILLILLQPLKQFAQDSLKPHKFGLLPPSKEDIRQAIFSSSFKLPTKFSLPTANDLSQDMPQPGDQGWQSSCVAWAVAYALKSFQEKCEHGWNYGDSNLFSPAFIYNLIKINRLPAAENCADGMTFPDALNILCNYGAVPIRNLAYNPEDRNGCLVPNPLDSPDLVQTASKYKIWSYERLLMRDTNEIKYYIAKRMPVLVGVMRDNSFEYGWKSTEAGAKFVWTPSPDSACIGYHAMVCVGYNDTLREFKILNSWGSKWGSNGYMYVPYDKFYEFVREAYIAYDAKSPVRINYPVYTRIIQPKADSKRSDTKMSGWFDVGNYMEFNDIKVGVTYVSASHDVVFVEYINSATDKTIQTTHIKTGETKSFTNNDKTISFRLDEVNMKKYKPSNPAADNATCLSISIDELQTDTSIYELLEKFKRDSLRMDKNPNKTKEQAYWQQQLKKNLLNGTF